MNKFLRKITLFSIPLIILLIAFEYSIRLIPSNFSFKNRLIQDKQDYIKTIIIGSSVANHGIDPSLVADSCVNFAMGGQSIRYNAAFLEKHINHLPNLKNVIWGLGYFMLWYDEYGNKHPNVTYYDLYMDIRFDNNILRQSELISVGNNSFNKWMDYYIFHNTKMFCDSLGLDCSFTSKKRNSNKQEWLSMMKTDAEKQNAITRRNRANEYYSFNVKQMYEVAELCQNKNINLYIVVPPTNKKFYEFIDTLRLNEIQQTLAQIAEGHNKVHILNYFKDNHFKDDDFFDGHHLSSDIGAKKFALILKKDIGL